jgi:hypothetical protein
MELHSTTWSRFVAFLVHATTSTVATRQLSLAKWDFMGA